MDTGWMRERLEAFVDFAHRYDELRKTGRFKTVGHQQQLWAEMQRAEPTVKEILRTLQPDLANFNLERVGGDLEAAGQARRGLGVLDDRAEWTVRLVPDAPRLPADRLHPWVWGAARTLWESGHYREAVEAAARAINAHTQKKVNRRDLSDGALMNNVLSPKTKPDEVYLKLPGDADDLTAGNRNRALRPFAEGCFAGIRNPAAHEHGEDWPEQSALEYLATLSVLARWIDACEVVTVKETSEAPAAS